MYNRVVLITCSSAVISHHSRFASNVSRESKMLMKLMTGRKRSKFGYNNVLDGPLKPKILIDGSGTPSKIASRRVTVLNKMFMGHVTDLIANGSVGTEIQGLGLIITNVLVCQNYHGLKILWTTNASIDYDLIEEKLQLINKRLRHHLCQMQLVGNVPHITFVRDKQESYFKELDHLFSIADYGEDHYLDDPKSQLECDFDPGQNMTQLNSSLPPMRHDVFGVDHSLIMGRIKQSMAKSKQAWKAYEENKLRPVHGSSKPFAFTTSFESIRQESQDVKRSGDILKQFLLKRKLLRKLKRKANGELNTSFDAGWYDSDEEDTYDWTNLGQDEANETYEEF